MASQILTDLYGVHMVNVWDLKKKAIVFTGGLGDAAKFLNVTLDCAHHSLARGGKIKKKLFKIKPAKQ